MLVRQFMNIILGVFLCLGFLILPAANAQKITEEKEVCGMCGEVRFIQRVVTRHSAGPTVNTPSTPGTSGGLLGNSPAGNLGGRLPKISGPDRGGYNEYTDRIFIDMDVGGTKVVELPAPSGVRRGDRVKVTGNIVQILEEGDF